jgi:predicted nucleic acid-binding protein
VIVVSDTSPFNYLVQMTRIDLLKKLFGSVYVPDRVVQELTHAGSPSVVRDWADNLPDWVVVRPAPLTIPEAVSGLDPGERDAIALAVEIRADRLLADDLRARKAAVQLGFQIVGTLGVLASAADAGHLDFEAAIVELLGLGFRASAGSIEGARRRFR